MAGFIIVHKEVSDTVGGSEPPNIVMKQDKDLKGYNKSTGIHVDTSV